MSVSLSLSLWGGCQFHSLSPSGGGGVSFTLSLSLSLFLLRQQNRCGYFHSFLLECREGMVSFAMY